MCNNVNPVLTQQNMLGLRSTKSLNFDECKILDKATCRHRATLESWHTAPAFNSDNNAQHLPEQHRFLLKKNRSQFYIYIYIYKNAHFTKVLCRRKYLLLLHVIVIVTVNHCPSSYIRRIVLYLASLSLSKTADWQSQARV